jgi:hypothetical protein
MLLNSLRKVSDKINKGIVNLRVPSAIPIGNYVHRKAMFAIICILAIVILGIIIEGFGSSKAVVYASSVNGIGAGIYWDQTCTNRTLSLDWGLLEAGSNNTLTVYIKNEGNSAISLFLRTSNWIPSAALGYMSLNWNYSGQVLSIDQVIPVELTLSVYTTAIGMTGFSFDTSFTTISES